MIVVLRALGLGDMLTAVPALRAIRRQDPFEEVVLAGPPALAPIAAWSGAVHRVVPTTGLEGPLSPSLGGARLACNLHGRGPESSRLLEATQPGRLVSFRHPGVATTAGGPDWDEDEHEMTRWCRLVDSAGFHAHPEDYRLPLPPAEHHPEPGGVVVHPGAASAARRWPAERWAALLGEMLSAGCPVVVTAGPSDQAVLARLRDLAPVDPRLTFFETSHVEQLAAVIAHARILVCGDTGPAHLATAFATPSVLLFGPTDPARWGPPRGWLHRVLWAGHRGDPHGDVVDPGLLELDTDTVTSAVDHHLRLTAVTAGAGGARAMTGPPAVR
jgi:ADP-heptose:LPS heptosyltransferase